METRRHRLRVLPGRLAICRLEAGAELPDWAGAATSPAVAAGDSVLSITRTRAETSIVCPEGRVPEGVRSTGGWRALEVAGPLEFAEVGVLAALARSLAAAGVSLFALSTYDTDYLLVQADGLERAAAALAAEGHEVVA